MNKTTRLTSLPVNFSEQMALTVLDWFNNCKNTDKEFDDSVEYLDGTFRELSRCHGVGTLTDYTCDRALFLFPNGRGASIVRSKFTHGGEVGLWELAVMTWDYKDENKDISSATAKIDCKKPLGSDVFGWLEPEEAAKLTFDVFKLDNRNGHQGSVYIPKVQSLTMEEIRALRAFSSPT